MTVEQFIDLPESEQIKRLKKESHIKDEFFIERMKTALIMKSPMPLVFLDGRLIKIYHNLKNKL